MTFRPTPRPRWAAPRWFPPLFLLVCVVLVCLPAGCRRDLGGPTGAPLVRVRLIEKAEQVLVAASEPPLIRTTSDTSPKRVNFPSGGAAITLGGDGWRAGNAVLGAGELTIEPAAVGTVRINGQSYRGRFRLVPVSADRFDVVNDVDVDSYLKSVVSKELLRDWEPEAYRAQAIVARTYALYESRMIRLSAPGRHWDLFPDVRSQVYGGLEAESAKSREAVDHTSGVVAAFGEPGQERIFKAYFSSCCGGIGQSAYDAFGEPYTPVLGEQDVGSLCNASPRFNWSVTIPKDELTRRIRAYGARRDRPEKDMGQLARIDIAATNRFGRPVQFIFTDTAGNRYSLGGEETRWAVNADPTPGTPTVNSSFFKPINEPTQVRFSEGHGWGHGVGMCQWCAQARAEKGERHEDIVLRAYPRAKLVRAY